MMARTFVIPPHQAVEIATAESIGRMIRVARTQQALRIDDAASLCHVSVALLSALENNGERSVKLDNMLTILDQLGLAIIITDKQKARKILTNSSRDSL